MKHEFKKFSAVLTAGVLSLSLLTGYVSPKASGNEEDSKAAMEATGEETSSEDSNEFDLPTLGLTVTMPETLRERMSQGTVVMFTNQIPMEDESALKYGYLSLSTAGGKQLDAAEIDMNTMEKAGVLGVYRVGMEDSLDELTGCDKHQELGQSEDGNYKYYLSVNTSEDEELVKEILEIKAEITEMAAYEPDSYYDEGDEQSGSSVSSVGEFSTQDVNGNPVTQDIFKENKLTMVNVFATWCTPCVQEMPDLEKLHQEMKDKNVGVVGIVLDVLDEKGEIVEENLKKAQVLVEKTGVTYPVLLPDSTYLNGRLTSIYALPESFFVDSDGNIVGETYSGSAGFEDWLETVEKELANLEAGA